MRFYSLAAIASSLLALCMCSLAQARTGEKLPEKPKEKPYALIYGTVWDPDSHPIYGIKVKIRRADDKKNKVRWELYSNHTGEFAQRVPVGPSDYILWADVKGVKTIDGRHLQPGPEVTLHIAGDERADTGLHLTW